MLTSSELDDSCPSGGVSLVRQTGCSGGPLGLLAMCCSSLSKVPVLGGPPALPWEFPEDACSGFAEPGGLACCTAGTGLGEWLEPRSLGRSWALSLHSSFLSGTSAPTLQPRQPPELRSLVAQVGALPSSAWPLSPGVWKVALAGIQGEVGITSFILWDHSPAWPVV